jgi:hypothetical protein
LLERAAAGLAGLEVGGEFGLVIGRQVVVDEPPEAVGVAGRGGVAVGMHRWTLLDE